MKAFIKSGGKVSELKSLDWYRDQQASEIMRRIASFIPHEGVDYDVEMTFSDANRNDISLKITPYTKKGTFWRDYVTMMLKAEGVHNEK